MQYIWNMSKMFLKLPRSISMRGNWMKGSYSPSRSSHNFRQASKPSLIPHWGYSYHHKSSQPHTPTLDKLISIQEIGWTNQCFKSTRTRCPLLWMGKWRKGIMCPKLGTTSIKPLVGETFLLNILTLLVPKCLSGTLTRNWQWEVDSSKATVLHAGHWSVLCWRVNPINVQIH